MDTNSNYSYGISNHEIYNGNTRCECCPRNRRVWNIFKPGRLADKQRCHIHSKSKHFSRHLWNSKRSSSFCEDKYDNFYSKQNPENNIWVSGKDSDKSEVKTFDYTNFKDKVNSPNSITEKYENEDATKSSYIGVAVHEFLKDVSIAGVRYAAMRNASTIRRVIWLMLVILGFTFMIFQFYDRINFYVSNPTVVDSSINQKPKIEFPTVTICNENIIHKRRANSYPNFTDIVGKLYPPWPDPFFQPDFQSSKEVFYELESHLNLTWDQIWRHLSPLSEPKVILQCSFNGRGCNLEDFKIVATNLGHCYQFNGENQSYWSTRAGSTYGLSISLNIDQSAYLYSKSRAAGYRVLLQSKNDLPSVQELGFKVSAGQVTSVAMRLKTITQLAKPFGNCSDEKGYFFKKCADACLHNFVIQRCACKYYYYEGSDVKSCNPEEMFVCADNATSDFIARNLLTEICDCPPQCEVHQYDYKLSSAIFSNAAMNGIFSLICGYFNISCTDEIIANNWKQAMRNDMCEMEIYYDEMVHEEVKTKRAYTLLALLCDIGGALGLILGSTVLTLFEILDFIVVFFHNYISFHPK